MNLKRTFKRAAIAIVILMVIQTVTYLFLSQGLLKKELFTNNYFGGISHSRYDHRSIDSAYVRDFYVTDCGMDLRKFLSNDLKPNENELKEKLGVSFIQFQDRNDRRWDVPDESKYRMSYHTWLSRNDYSKLFGLFSIWQTEEILIDSKLFYQVDTHYRWILFFWTKSFERVELVQCSQRAENLY